MLEVALTAFKTVLEMDANPEIGEQEFITALKCDKLLDKVSKTLESGGVSEQSDAYQTVVNFRELPKEDRDAVIKFLDAI